MLAGPDVEASGLSAYTLEDLSQICEQRFGRRKHPWSLGRLLKKLGRSRQKTRPIAPKQISLTHDDYPDERLIACCNPALAR